MLARSGGRPSQDCIVVLLDGSCDCISSREIGKKLETLPALLDRTLRDALQVVVEVLNAIAGVVGQVAKLDQALCKRINEFLVPYWLTT
mgnify:FL=1